MSEKVLWIQQSLPNSKVQVHISSYEYIMASPANLLVPTVCEFGVFQHQAFFGSTGILNTLSLGIQLCLRTDGDFTGRPRLRFAKDWR